MSALRLAAFADSFPISMKDKVEKLADDLETKTAAKMEELIDEPVLSGRLRQSRRLLSARSGLRLGWEEISGRKIDPGGGDPINIRRHKSKPYRRKLKGGKLSAPFTRLLGSDKASSGFTYPAFKSLRLAWEEIVKSVNEE